MRTPSLTERPVTVTIAGSDSGGGAGVQADLRTMAALETFPTSVVTSVTAQHTQGVDATHVLPPEEVTAQADAVRGDFDLQAGKTGMLATAEIVDRTTTIVGDADAPFVVDPVMVAASGDRLLAPDAEQAYEALIAESRVVTPNADEIRMVTGVDPTDAAGLRAAGDRLVQLGADAAFCTGGHVDGDPVRDVLVVDPDAVETDEPPTTESSDGLVTESGETAGGNRTYTITHERIDTAATHGSGCTLSSAIAARLAHGDPVVPAVVDATRVVTRAVRYPFDVGRGPGAVNGSAVRANEAARHDTREAGERVLDRLTTADVSPILPEVGMNVVAATPYAERVGETAAIEGRLRKTTNGVAAARGMRFGASSHVARFLLAARESDPSLRFAANCRFDERVERAMTRLGWETVELDRTAEPDPDHDGRTMGWAAQQAMDRADATPDAVFDRGAVGKESMVRVLADDGEELADRLVALSERVGE